MSTVKITELPAITTIGSNTSNTIMVGVDLPTNITGKINLTTLARSLYSNNNLYVGNTLILLPNAVAQFSSNSDNYVQVNLQNERPNGSGDLVVTADTGTDEDYFIDMGFNNSTYNFPGYTFARPLDGYLVVQGNNTSPTAIGGNLVIGTTTVGKDIIFSQGTIGNTGQVGRFIYNTGFKLVAKPLIFADNTTQNTAIDYPTINSRITSNTATLRGEISSNVSGLNSSISANVVTLRGEISANVSTLNASITTNTATVNTFAQAAFNKANNALANVNGTIFTGDLIVSGNITAQGIPGDGINSPIVFMETGNVFSANAQAFSYNNANSSILVKNGVKTGVKIFPGSQTATTLNITNDALVKCNIAADLTVTLSAFDSGKIVELWITNTSGNQRVVTHGVSALNSTINSTTFNMPATSSARVVYYSFGNDLANTFVVVNYA
jgi:hypothetical protein